MFVHTNFFVPEKSPCIDLDTTSAKSSTTLDRHNPKYCLREKNVIRRGDCRIQHVCDKRSNNIISVKVRMAPGTYTGVVSTCLHGLAHVHGPITGVQTIRLSRQSMSTIGHASAPPAPAARALSHVGPHEMENAIANIIFSTFLYSHYIM
ncbi:hypothetical protein EVAR_10397_1 [Eumeta japonica]|uniref:Uncharacterized protein n=1 Tax=Eumeta variegata TaxID=151549 RepID=A0A4C1UCF3_EUMVA|nr:hypothetical protein EVAR_10397_1 [Eumeta japonica]